MISIAKDIHINRPAAEVFKFLEDFANDKKWQSDLVGSEITSSGPIRVGSTAVLAQKFMGTEIRSEVLVTEFEPPRRVGFKTTSGPVQLGGSCTLEEMGGGTHFSVKLEGQPGGVLKLAEGLLARELEKFLGRGLATLKEILEA